VEITSNQSNSGNKIFLVEKAVNQKSKQSISDRRVLFDQSPSSSQSSFSSNAQPNLSSGRKKQTVRHQKEQFHQSDDSEGDDMTPDERDMWSKLVKATDKSEAAAIIQPAVVRRAAKHTYATLWSK
jgi:hypothetical protein